MINVNFDPKIFVPKFFPLLDNKDRYLILPGGRGGGKSVFLAQKLIYRCLKEKFFRYILLRKTYESIKDSQYQTIKDLVYEYGLDSLFTFKTSPLRIECINGNSFIAKGLDKPEKTKSISDPTGIWYEEGNEITEEDFITSTTSIRTTKAEYIQEVFSFNPESPEADYRDFWIYKRWFANHSENSFTSQVEIELPDGEKINSTYTVLHSTYKDNLDNLTPEYVAELEGLKTFNYYYYLVFVLGEWGNEEIKSPFAFAFSRDKHAGKTLWDANLETYLSFDFNKEPLTCLVAQKPKFNSLVGIENIFVNNLDIDELCNRIRAKYPNALFIITGDQTGETSTAIKKGLTYYRLIKENLELTEGQIKLPGKNPTHQKSRLETNMILNKCDVVFDEVSCKETINDLIVVEYDSEKKKIIKNDRSKESQRADFLDCFRYMVHTFMRDELKYLGIS